MKLHLISRPTESCRSKHTGLHTAAPILTLAAVLVWWIPSPHLPAHPKTTRYTVQVGDSEWSIAQRLDPGDDPRQVVDWIEAHNSLGSGQALRPGTVLVVPVSTK